MPINLKLIPIRNPKLVKDRVVDSRTGNTARIKKLYKSCVYLMNDEETWRESMKDFLEWYFQVVPKIKSEDLHEKGSISKRPYNLTSRRPRGKNKEIDLDNLVIPNTKSRTLYKKYLSLQHRANIKEFRESICSFPGTTAAERKYYTGLLFKGKEIAIVFKGQKQFKINVKYDDLSYEYQPLVELYPKEYYYSNNAYFWVRNSVDYNIACLILEDIKKNRGEKYGDSENGTVSTSS